MSGEMMKVAMELLDPYLREVSGREHDKIGKIVMATVAGDIHDIGKNIATMVLDVNGFQVLDLGVDVPAEKIVGETKVFGADIVGLSGLLTLAFDPMKEVVGTLKAEGMQDEVKVIVGGGQMDDKAGSYIGADAAVNNVGVAVGICKGWVAK